MNTTDKIQSALLCVQIAIGVVQVITTFFFIRSVGITGQQEKDAREQINLARVQMDMMSSQYRESLRPLITVTRKAVDLDSWQLELRNDGQGAALRVECDPAIRLHGTIIGIKGTITAHIRKHLNHSKPRAQFFTLTYRSIDDQKYMTSFYQRNDEFYVVDYRHLRNDEDLAAAIAFREGYVAAER